MIIVCFRYDTIVKDYQVVTIGDAMLDIFLLLSPKEQDAMVSQNHHEFHALLGAKIPIEDAAMELGGNATNTAVGLTRLGVQVGLMAELGDDDFAHHIRGGLRKERVSMEYCIYTKQAPSTFSVVLNFGIDRTIFSRHCERTHMFDFSSISTEWIYLNSMGKQWEHAYLKTFAFVQKNTCKFAFTPGSRQLYDESDVYRKALPLCDILFINREEGEFIAYGKEHPQGISQQKEEKLLHDLQLLGPKIVSVTDGVKGAYAIDEKGEIYHQKILPSTMVEKTGVGDAYASGFLAAIVQGKDIPEAMLWGVGNSASVIEHVGAIVGLLGKKELEKRIYAE